jgi:Cdc6-like AAA superfamily ATPase
MSISRHLLLYHSTCRPSKDLYLDIDLTDEPDPSPKRVKSDVPELTVEERYELDQLKWRKVQTRTPETKIELSPEQEKVINIALGKNNTFLTGAAGCGTTVTLKEILARLNRKKMGRNHQVVAPTGISALPLDGKTTYSFAGVKMTSPGVRKARAQT